MKVLLTLSIALGAVLLFLLTSASSNTALFARHYPWLLGINGAVALVLIGRVGWRLRGLRREYKEKVFGSRLKFRLVLMFSLMAVLPGVLIYAVSVQFVTRSIDSWFDVRVEKALEAGLNLGRSTLDAMLAELTGKARNSALQLAEQTDLQRSISLNRLREQAGAETAALFGTRGEMIASATGELGKTGLLAADIPSTGQLKQVRLSRVLSSIDGDPGADMTLRVLVAVPSYGLLDQGRILLLTKSVPNTISTNAEAVQTVYRDYQELSLAREGLTRIYAATLTLTLLLALFTAIAAAFELARRLSAPLSILAEGTQAVAAGDFSPRQAVKSRDELGVLTQSFNQMTRQLDDARAQAEKNRAEVESSRAYLEGILANLSAGVLAFDRRFVLRAFNQGACGTLGDNFVGLADEPIEGWPRQTEFGRALRDQFAGSGEQGEWQREIELERPNAAPQVLLARGSKLPDATGGGYVVVFDDITQLIAAQRSAAWGEVARRLAHEIKNPLTPIQLSAERLQHKLADKLEPAAMEILDRATHTIVNQVQAMKRMVDEFRDYARMPLPQPAPLDLNALINELLGLYESSHAQIITQLAPNLPLVLGDATQLRQIVHNLLRNAEDALAETAAGRITLSTARDGANPGLARLTISDNGPGFPAEIIARIFEPYVTTKQRGTGLGMAIVKKIVDEHGGRIDISNPPHGGAEVTLTLPFVTEDEHGANPGC